MMKIKGIRDFSHWLKKGETILINNQLGLIVVDSGDAEFIEHIETKQNKTKRRLNLLKKYSIAFKPTYSFKNIIEIIDKVEKKYAKERLSEGEIHGR